VFGTNRTNFRASHAIVSGTRVGLIGSAHAVGGGADEHPRLVAGDIGEEL